MTRINVVPVQDLTRQELLGEYKEITRPFNKVIARVNKGQSPSDVKGIPADYKMGQGHETFFFDKVQYLYDRYVSICGEMLERGYNVNLELFNDLCDKFQASIPREWWGDYVPTPEAIAINIERMIENGTR